MRIGEKVRDATATDVVTMNTDTSVTETARLLDRHRFGGLPVVDHSNRVVDISTKRDLFLGMKPVPRTGIDMPAPFDAWVARGGITDAYDGRCRRTAAPVMTSPVVSAALTGDLAASVAG